MGSFVCFFSEASEFVGIYIHCMSSSRDECCRRPCEGLFCRMINFGAIMLYVACFFSEASEFIYIHIHYTFNLFVCMNSYKLLCICTDHTCVKMIYMICKVSFRFLKLITFVTEKRFFRCIQGITLLFCHCH